MDKLTLKDIWVRAYCAALAGLTNSGTNKKVAESCSEHARLAVQAFASEYENEAKATQAKTKAGDGKLSRARK